MDTPFFDTLIDDFGIWQHTDGQAILRHEGYALDDAARGLLLCLALNRTSQAEVLFDYLRLVVGSQLHFRNSGVLQLADDQFENRLIANGQHWLGQIVSERAESRAETAGHDDRLERNFVLLDQILKQRDINDPFILV